MKSTLLLLLCLITGFQTYAQYENSKFTFGGKIGFSFSAFTKDIGPFDEPDRFYSDYERSFRGSATPGVTMNVELPKKFNFGAELLFSTKGMTYYQENDNVVTEDDQGNLRQARNYYHYNIDYLELPLTINYNFKPESSKTELYGYIGLAPSFAVNHKTRLKYPRKDPDHENEKANLQNVRSLNKSIIAGIQFAEGPSYLRGLYFDLRGSYTLSPVFNKRVDAEEQNLNTRMYTFTLALGLRF